MESVPARISSFLPSIKCSNCNVDIPISQMGDHACSQAPPIPSSRLNVLDGPFAPNKEPSMAYAAEQSPLPKKELLGPSVSVSAVRLPFSSDDSSATSSRSASPVLPPPERRSPYHPSPGSLIPRTHSQLTLDEVAVPPRNAAPSFQTHWSRPVTPVSPMDSVPHHSPPEIARAPPALDAQRSFGSANPMPADNSAYSLEPPEDSHEPSQTISHRKSTSTSTPREFHRPTSVGAAKFHMPRPSASSSVYTRNRSMSTVSGTSRYDFDSSDVPSVPSLSERGPMSPEIPAESPVLGGNEFDFGLTKPQHNIETAEPDSEPIVERPKDPSPYMHKPKPSVTAAMAPLNSIGSSSSFKPSRSIKGRKPSTVTTTTTATASTVEANSKSQDSRLQDAPPVPSHLNVTQTEPQSSLHTPNESTSSNGSWGSGNRTGSSRSSPPLQESPQRTKNDRPADHDADRTFQGFQFGVQNPPPILEEQPESSAYERYYEPSKPAGPLRPPSLSTQPTLPNILPPEPMEQIPEDPPFNSPDDYMMSSQGQAYPDSNQFHLSPDVAAPPISPSYPSTPRSHSPSQPQRPPVKSRSLDKGPCRACGEPIKGKSVSSADGRLTGRYHKGCFVCTTCGNPFQTADFYVLRNFPYCSRHYHELNNSLCQGCNRGIEGQYLETETYRKFHPYCFTCQECHRILRDDYFEWRGRTLCEQHAFKAANQPSSSLAIGGGGRRYPEKRSTKLMMMM